MTKEKVISLTKYLDDLTNKLNSKEIPTKHKNHPDTYKQFLKREADTVKKQLEAAKLEGVSK